MGTSFDMLDRSEKIRIILFAVVTVIVAVLAVLFIWSFRVLIEEPPVSMDDVKDITFDGANFNLFLLPMAVVLNGILTLFNAAFYVVVSYTIDSLVYGIFKIVFRKMKYTSKAEYILAKRALAAILIVSVVASLFVTRFKYWFFIALLILPIWFLGYVLYIYPLKHRENK